MLVVAEVLCGIPWGIFQTLTTAYASEVCPIQLRGYLTACECAYKFISSERG
jgi:SP family general alpha glucoside:H+ symporter-like MFS transporter